jgi:hypothetical protein
VGLRPPKERGIYVSLKPLGLNTKRKQTMTQKLEGVFQITGWDESPYQENDDGSKWSHAKIKQTYSGSIEGSSDVQYLT